MARLSGKEQKARFSKAKEHAKSLGGDLLSTAYRGVDAKYEWCCALGHEWEATYYSVVQKSRWCGRCNGTLRMPEEQLSIARNIAKDHGGLCLSSGYTSSKKNLEWKCQHGHVWEASLSNVSRGKWCPWCSGNKVDPTTQLKRAQQTAKSHGGVLLSDIYVGNKAPMQWRCAKGHQWAASFSTIVGRKSWCGRCRGTQRDSEEQLSKARLLAVSKSGQCLSKTYLNNSEPMEWKCDRDHKWKAPFYVVVQAGSWCPICSGGLRERLVRHTLEQLFARPFLKKRPAWLVNTKTGRKMELDGYNEVLSLAFEYQGEQHNRIVKLFKMTSQSLKNQQQRDELKRSLCLKNKVLLIEVPHDITPDDYPRYISTKIMRNKDFPLIRKKLRDWRLVKVTDWIESDSYTILDLRQHAARKNGVCLSEIYKGALIKHEWQCSEKHIWSATWDSVNRKSWCPYCSGNIVDPLLRLEQARKVAIDRGGACLATKYESANAHMRWRCRDGHEWGSRFSHVVQGGSWCPRCQEPRGVR